MPRFACMTSGFAIALLPALALAAEPERFSLDPVHTRVAFAISHAGFSNALGTVSGSTGTLAFDPDDWSVATLEASVPLSRLDLGDPKWNKAATASNLLDVAKYPTATFVSSRVETRDAHHARVVGMLTLHGVAREVALEVTFNALKRHPLPPFRRTAGFSATTTLSRKAFGIDAWPTVIGDSVELRIEAEALRQRAGDDGNDNATDNATDPPPAASSLPQAIGQPTTDTTP